MMNTSKVLLAVVVLVASSAAAPREELLNAIRKGNVEVVKSLLVGVDVNDKIGPVNLEAVAVGYSEMSPLLVALHFRQPDVVKMLLGVTGINVNRVYSGDFALLSAVVHGTPEIVELLLKAGANVNLLPSHPRCRTALINAVFGSNPNPEIIRLLLTAGAKDVAGCDDGRTALMLVVSNPKAEAIVELLLKAGSSLTIVDKGGRNVLDTALLYRASPKIIALLKEYGAVATEKKIDLAAEHRKELMNAIRKGDVKVVESLLAGIDVNTRLDGKADEAAATSEEGDSPLMYAIAYKQLDVVEMLLGVKNINVNKIFHGISALNCAVVDDEPEIVELLLKAGAEANLVPPGGGSALITAANHGNLEIVKLLLAAGANVHAVEPSRGRTPLMMASSLGYDGIVELLLEAGSSVKAVNKDGLNALELAIESNSPKVVALLKEYRAVDTGKRTPSLALTT